MTVVFRTAIDCCKRYMGGISGLPLSAINPMVGDTVLVYHDISLEVWLRVVSRSWRLTNGSSPVLTVDLHLQEGWTIPMLEKVLRDG